MEVFTINQLGRIISYEEMEGYGMQVVSAAVGAGVGDGGTVTVESGIEGVVGAGVSAGVGVACGGALTQPEIINDKTIAINMI